MCVQQEQMNLDQHEKACTCSVCLQAEQSHDLKSQVESLQEQVKELRAKGPNPTAPIPTNITTKQDGLETRLKTVEERLNAALPTPRRKCSKNKKNNTNIHQKGASEVGSSSDSDGVGNLRYVYGKGQNAEAFLRDIELSICAQGTKIRHTDTRMMDTAISKSDRRVREDLNQWRKNGCPVEDTNGVLDIYNRDGDSRREWYGMNAKG